MGYLKEKYTKEYFLGSIDKTTNRIYGAGGFESLKGGRLNKRYKWFLNHLHPKEKVVLDIGCGRGEVVNWCAKKGAKKVIGIDFSRDAIQIATELNKNNSNVELFEMEAKNINFEIMFDIVFMFDVIEHIPDKEMQGVYHKIYSVLKNNGMLILSTPIYNSAEEKDSSDFIEATKGMHCNKQTKEKLVSDLVKHKFRQYSINVWGRSDGFSISAFLYANILKFKEFSARQLNRVIHSVKIMYKFFNKFLKIKNE